MMNMSEEHSGDDVAGNKSPAEAGGTSGGGVVGVGTHVPKAVGRLVDSSQADDRRMIALVRARRLLYARNNMPVASYYAQVKQLWEEVANEMGRSVAEVRRKWSHIRNSYSRHLRNEVAGARTSRGRVVSRWYLAEELDFLKEHMATDTRVLSSTSPSLYAYQPASYLEMDMSEAGAGAGAGAVAEVDVKPFANSWLGINGVNPLATPVGEPKQEPHSVYSGGEDSCSSIAAAQDEESSYFQFFRGLYGDYNELSPRRRRLFRRQCLTLLHSRVRNESHSSSRRCGAGRRSVVGVSLRLAAQQRVQHEALELAPLRGRQAVSGRGQPPPRSAAARPARGA
ncbi:alcohol dehydrogenase transcription factor myb/SANT-like domain-containing protein [Phthorimaea operculella]|nr:alcohol dehydrogenase transcription factor myb/SANT-like domain-containing protein [Phthorimaea operculella]